MTQKELLQELSQFVMKAYVGPQNTETGFLTHHHVNSLTKEQATDFLQETEAITRQMVEQMEQSFEGNVPTDYECGVIFQYVFDKTTEAAFKQLTGKDIDTQYYVPEAFEYYEPDLPEYIKPREYVSVALRTARDLDADEADWMKFVEDLRRKSQQ